MTLDPTRIEKNPYAEGIVVRLECATNPQPDSWLDPRFFLMKGGKLEQTERLSNIIGQMRAYLNNR